MPKEMIHCRDFGRMVPVGVPEDGKPVELAQMDTDAMKVGWSKEAEHVELAVVQSVDGAFVEHGFMTEADTTERDCEKLIRLARLTPRYIQLDRAGINRLIHSLRQARDDAFGRDA